MNHLLLDSETLLDDGIPRKRPEFKKGSWIEPSDPEAADKATERALIHVEEFA